MFNHAVIALCTLGAVGAIAHADPKPTPSKAWDQMYGYKGGSENLRPNPSSFLFHCPRVANVVGGNVTFSVRLDDSPMKRLHSNDDADVKLNAMRSTPAAIAHVALVVGKDGVVDQAVKLSDDNRTFVTQRADLAKTSQNVPTSHAAMYEGSRDLGALHVVAKFTTSSAGRYLDLTIAGVPSSNGDESGQCTTRMQGGDYKEPPSSHRGRDAGEWCRNDEACASHACDQSTKPGTCL